MAQCVTPHSINGWSGYQCYVWLCKTDRSPWEVLQGGMLVWYKRLTASGPQAFFVETKHVSEPNSLPIWVLLNITRVW